MPSANVPADVNRHMSKRCGFKRIAEEAEQLRSLGKGVAIRSIGCVHREAFTPAAKFSAHLDFLSGPLVAGDGNIVQ